MAIINGSLSGKDKIAQVARDWITLLKEAGLIGDSNESEEAALEAAAVTASAVNLIQGSNGQGKEPLLLSHVHRLADLISDPALLGWSRSPDSIVTGSSALQDTVMRSLAEFGAPPEPNEALEIGKFFGWVTAHASIAATHRQANPLPAGVNQGDDDASDKGDRMEKEAGSLLALKEEFISVASHELKTPLTSVKAYAQMAQRQLQRQLADGTISSEMVPNLERIAGHMAVINAQADRLCRLINEFLDISRLESGALEMNTRIIDLTVLTTRAIRVFEDTIESSRVNLSAHSEPILVQADADRMEQVVINLLMNAHMYSPLARPIEVTTDIVRCQQTDKLWGEIRVRDYGIGIAEADLPNIFERFYSSSHPEDLQYHGIGVGLYISAEITRKHNGEIWATSARKKGSTFGVKLPLVDRTPRECPQAPC